MYPLVDSSIFPLALKSKCIPFLSCIGYCIHPHLPYFHHHTVPQFIFLRFHRFSLSGNSTLDQFCSCSQAESYSLCILFCCCCRTVPQPIIYSSHSSNTWKVEVGELCRYTWDLSRSLCIHSYSHCRTVRLQSKLSHHRHLRSWKSNLVWTYICILCQ